MKDKSFSCIFIFFNSGRKIQQLRSINVNYQSLCIRDIAIKNINYSIFNRSFTTESNSSGKINEINTTTQFYNTSKVQQELCKSHDLQSKQTSETFPTNKTTIKDRIVWSTQSPHNIHISPLVNNTVTPYISTAKNDEETVHETKVYTTQGKLNLTDSNETHTVKSEITSTSIAEVPVKSNLKESVPKISATELYSKSSSLNADFDSSQSSISNSKKITYETTNQSKIFGGQNTSADTKIRPNENPFDTKQKVDMSDDSEEIPKQNESDIRNNILRESLNYVHEKGWTMEAIRAGIKKCQQPETAESLFYNSYDLVDFFMRDANAQMIAYMTDKANKENIEANRLLIEGLQYRLKLVIPYANTWEEALAQKGLPPNAKRAWKSLLDLANSAWLCIGDTSTDMKWYTKRISVATIYRSAEIYMLQDKSIDKIDSMNFLDRHLADYQTTGTVQHSVSQSVSDTVQVASGLLTVVRTMTMGHK